jgi:protocatechuate 3,4-dioxygenase beta subunit
MSLGGTVGLTGVLAACAGGSSSSVAAPSTAAAPTNPPAGADLVTLLNRANTCALTKELTQGPYWFDVDSIRADIREDRPGAVLALALRVHDVTGCTEGSAATAVPNAVVELWHCDAGGVYSGFQSASRRARQNGAPTGPPPARTAGGPNPSGGGPPGAGAANSSGGKSDGSYSVGDTEATTTDDATYLRGAQVADAQGIVKFTTIYPGWYAGRTTHIHCKVHLDKKTVLTTQLYLDDSLTQRVYGSTPYNEHTGRDTTNSSDSIFDRSGLLTVQPQGVGYLGVVNLGVDV